MNIALFGATGTVGQLVIEQALEAGHTITAFSRNPDKLTRTHKKLRSFKGDVLDYQSVLDAVRCSDAVICALGMPILNNDKIRSRGTKNIVEAMNASAVSRIICLSSMGVGDSHQLLSPKYKYLIAPLFMRRLFADHELQEQYIKESNLDWTVVRPGSFTKALFSDEYRHGFTKSDKPSKIKISPLDLASFLLNQLTNNTYLHRSPCISY
jgi:putative NADH-flavin reductase